MPLSRSGSPRMESPNENHDVTFNDSKLNASTTVLRTPVELTMYGLLKGQLGYLDGTTIKKGFIRIHVMSPEWYPKIVNCFGLRKGFVHCFST